MDVGESAHTARALQEQDVLNRDVDTHLYAPNTVVMCAHTHVCTHMFYVE